MKRFKAYTLEKGLIETNNFIDFDKLTLHRLDGPAYIKYYNNGNIEYEEYFINDKRHRTDGPVFTEYHDNGTIKYEAYYVNDKLHRLDGPAYIKYYNNGNIEYEEYWINGITYTKKQYFKELLKLKVKYL